MFDRSSQVFARLDGFRRDHRSDLYLETAPVEVTAWEVPDEPVPFATARDADYRPFTVGGVWGRPWGTTWFRVRGEVPASWADVADAVPELVVDLGFEGDRVGFQAEGLAWRADGTVIKAVEPENQWVRVGGPGEGFEVFLEAASNPYVTSEGLVHAMPLGDKRTAGTEPIYRLQRLEVGLRDVPVWELFADVEVLRGLARTLPDGTRRAEIVAALADMLDAVAWGDLHASAPAARAILAPVLERVATASAHTVHAVGHAHIDSAWLWPVRETRRKCARTFSNVLDLIDADPGVTFACSSAQQYQWVKDGYPDVWERMKAAVAAGRFVPVGGMWVESDINLIGGEALVRQFLAGTRFFIEEFGVEPLEVWLPDSFGYSAAVPQIARLAGKKYFLTQKMSWNDTNRFPHHTFWWEGLDGTRIFTHFPPADTYNGTVSADELLRSERGFAERGRATRSLLPYGYGDGGGGPTREMLQSARRFADLEGAPRVELSTPQRFFDEAIAEYPDAPVWSGEMYLEKHRGTYTSQHRTKAGNRRNEHLLREAELWAATASVRTGTPYPREALDRLWRRLLLLQFHDILPGSSIAWVHQESEAAHAALTEDLRVLITSSLQALGGDAAGAAMANPSPFPVRGVPGLGIGTPDSPARPVALSRGDDGELVLDNGVVRVTIDPRGLVTSLVDLRAGRELVAPGEPIGRLHLHDDHPLNWGAWDIDDYYRNTVVDLDEADSVDATTEGEAVVVRVRRHTPASTIVQEYRLDPGDPELGIGLDIDWHERNRLLKLAVPVDLRADAASSEIQFGHLDRPIAVNTSWDAARFETAAHRWVRVGETGYGVALTNSCTYGHDITRHTRDDGGTTTVMRATVLRSPVFPDPEADQGDHHLSFGVVAGATVLDAVAHGYRRNLPARDIRGAAGMAPLVRVDNPAVVVEAVKLAEDDDDLVVRLYEALGSRAGVTVAVDAATRGVVLTDLLERPLDDQSGLTTDDTGAHLVLRPYQIVTLRWRRG
ncbi:MAG TPA: glycoside hydrolase family 38 C-terminal domain-containing protein [Propionibacteriaceae bacterium]|nr:glycoside hydrolase family 38 C-terminal domain-containing protein [Propionibacteriaceae bacterium]